MATPSSRAFTYDLFLSFRGEDTRYGFTGNLYKALHDRGIHTFLDDKKLRSGEEITPALMKAIQDSRVAITVLSQNYASSSFCLDELAVILDCESKGLSIIPIFYKVDPSDVRHQEGRYGEALTKYQKRFKDKKEKLQKWKMALHQVANLSGFHFQEGFGYEYKFIGSIVDQVSREINPARLYVTDYPVGLGSQVLEVRKLLNVESGNGFQMIAIYGMGGIGKTTLALAVYNLIAVCFDGSCFLQNVREKSNKHGLEHLQSILLSKILGEKDINLASENEGISMLQQRLQRRKVLLILDDVDKCEQLKALVGSPDWFGPGSRVIITTRDTQLLASHEVKRKYKVKKLNKNDALQLLTWKAFKREQVDPSYVEVLNDVVTYASGLPLALEVIGSNLFEKSVEQWKSAINQYKRIPNNQILEKLKVSFKALEEEEKSVFLDIACCFRGYKLTEVEIILRVLYYDCTKHHIGVLVEKSLIKGTRKIEIICLDFSTSEKEETVECNENTFVDMENLKILINRNVKFSKCPNYFPESLKVMEWHRYPSNCLPSNFYPNNLVICKLPGSCFMSFEFHGLSKKYENLTVLNFDKCNYLTQIPDVSDLLNLEKLSFKWCESLISLHDSIGFLTKLKILNAEGCRKLLSFPDLDLTSLEKLELSYCSSLENFPEILGKMGKIRKLSLSRLPIKELPVSFQNLTGLQQLDVNCAFVRLSSIVLTPELSNITVYDCKGWQWVNSEEGEEKVGSIVSSKVDTFLALSCNMNDDIFSAGFTLLEQVSYLWLRESNVTFLPECIKEFHNLVSLDVNDSKHLQEIRGVPPNLKRFSAMNCISLTSSGSSMLLNQVDEERISFLFPGASIPGWFDHQRRGPSISFWFRNKFPVKVLCLLIAPVLVLNALNCALPMVFINGKVQVSRYFREKKEVKMLELDYTHIFDLRELHLDDDLMEVCLEKEWNHVEVTFEGVFETLLIKAIGIHVVKEEGRSMEDIRYEDPHINTKHDNHLNTSQSQNHIFFKNLALRLTHKFLIGSFLFFSCFLFFILFTSLRTNPA